MEKKVQWIAQNTAWHITGSVNAFIKGYNKLFLINTKPV